MCVLYVEIMRAGRIELGWAHDVFIIAYHTFMHFSCIRTSLFYHIDIDCVWFSSACLSLSLFLLVSLRMTPKHKSIPSRNPLCSRAASSSNPTPSSVWFLDEKACQDFSENFSRSGIHSEHQVILSNFSDRDLPTIIYCRGWESLYNISDTCPSMIIHEFYSNMHEFNYFVPHFITRVWSTRIVFTPDLISEVLHVLRLEFTNYPGCPCFRTMSKDELMSLFYKTPLSWGDRQNTPCSGFAKGPRFLNMMMTFVLHSLSHYTLFLSLVLDFCYLYLRELLLTFPPPSYSLL